MDDTLALYVHIPFCRSKCAYCDFNSYAGQEPLIPRYVDALLREAALWSERCEGKTAESVYFGGGTPSLLPVDELERVLTGLRHTVHVAAEAEVSLEANPETVDDEYLRQLRCAGVNRLSLGVQSFDDEELRFLGRIHDAVRAEQAFQEARKAGFDNINLDLIFGLPGQSPSQWERTLQGALRLAPEHLSLYALTVEDGTPLGALVAAGECAGADEDEQAELYQLCVEQMASAGYVHYEISNWARPDHECRHNLVYWHNEPYLGLGAGAHSFIEGRRLGNVQKPDRYIELVEACGSEHVSGALPHVESVEEPNVDREMSDTVILALRLTRGLSLVEFERRFGVTVEERYGRQIGELRELGLAEVANGLLRLTDRGRLLANEASLRFLP